MQFQKHPLTMVLLLGISTSWAFPQAVQEDEKEMIKPVPVITGYSGFVTTFEPGNPNGRANIHAHIACSLWATLALRSGI